MFKNCKNSIDVREELVKLIKSHSLESVQEAIAKKFYNVNDVVEFLYNSIIAGGNGILYGPGGFGKTEITKAFFSFYGIEPLVIVGHSGTDVEALLGIPNIGKLTNESVYEVAFEKSVFSKAGVLIFEEFLDVKPAVASALKDIITSGGYRRGDEFIPSKIGQMFICSNKSPDEVSIDSSTAAFYKERFPYSKYVVWDNYSSKEYLNLFELVYQDRFNDEKSSMRLIAELCATSCINGKIISPRMAFSALNLFLLNKDIDILKMVSDINTNKIDEIKKKIQLEDQYKALNSNFLNLMDIISDISFDTIDEAIAFKAKGTQLKLQISFSNIEGDELIKNASTLISYIDNRLESAERKLMQEGALKSIEKFDTIYEDIQKFLSKQ